MSNFTLIYDLFIFHVNTLFHLTNDKQNFLSLRISEYKELF